MIDHFPQKPESEPKATRPRTAAQIAASRENGRESKGPITQAGLNRSKMNAVKHGLCGESSSSTENPSAPTPNSEISSGSASSPSMASNTQSSSLSPKPPGNSPAPESVNAIP